MIGLKLLHETTIYYSWRYVYPKGFGLIFAFNSFKPLCNHWIFGNKYRPAIAKN
jgi:hypothetical protein